MKQVRGLLSSRGIGGSEYPNLIKQGERISTIAVPTVLVALIGKGVQPAISALRASLITCFRGSTSWNAGL